MQLNKNEKELLKFLVKRHIDQVDKANDIPNLPAEVFIAEEQYEAFLRKLLKKIK
jgi:hypothetical protein